MTELAVYRGLLWKEWKDNGRLFGLGFILIGWQNLFYPIFHWLIARNETGSSSAYFWEWALNLRSLMNQGNMGASSPMVNLGIVMAIAFGVLLLSHERSSSLEFLISTPASRKEIIVGKFLAGASALLVIMLVHTVLVVLALSIGPAVPVSRLEVIQWSGFITIAWICLFTLGLLASTLCRNFAVAGLATGFLANLPSMLAQFAAQIASHFFDSSGEAALTIYNFMDHFNLWPLVLGVQNSPPADSVNAGSSFSIGVFSSGAVDYQSPVFSAHSIGLMLALLAASLLFLALAIWLFNRNQLEKSRDLLMFGNFKQVAIIFISFLVAWERALAGAASLPAFAGYFILYFLAVYLLFILFVRFIALFRIREWLGR